MCTAAWLIRPGGYELYFNRDESIRRLPARPPSFATLAGVRCLFPVDGDAGGTWLGVNELGVTLGLLNSAGESDGPLPIRSRGLLVVDCLDVGSGRELEQRLRASDLSRYRGFRLACFAPDEEPLLFVWDGAVLTRETAQLPLSSSSLDARRAEAERRAVLERMARGGLDRSRLEAFQASHEPERGPWSPCMHRSDASTVSASRVVVGRDAIDFRYAPGPPCTTGFGESLTLPRASVRSSSRR